MLFLLLLLAVIPLRADELDDAMGLLWSGKIDQGMSALRSIAKKGNVKAQLLLGRAYTHENSTVKHVDYSEAMKWFKKNQESITNSLSVFLGDAVLLWHRIIAMRTLRFALSILVVFIILFLGCQRAAIAYRLRRDGLDPILLPPMAGEYPSESVSIAIKHAREANSTTTGCDIGGELISLHWQKSTADISFRPQAFFVSVNQSPDQVARGFYVDPLFGIDKFRLDLTERQSKGCLSPLEGERLRRAIVENLPLPPAIAYFLQMGSYDVTGYIDLTPDFRMQVTDPIYPPGAEPSVANLLGYETANYTFIREGRENQMRLRLASASEVPINGESFEKQTLHNELPFSKSPGYFRLLFMAEESTSNRITRSVLLSAPDENKLSQAIPRRGMSPNEFCSTVSMTNVSCTVFPKNFGVSPELRILVNRKEVFLRVGGMVQEVLNLETAEGPPASLKILRPFHGRLIPIKFDPSSGDILKFVLLPGDQVTF